MAILIDNFKSQLVGGGARANQFKVVLNFPAGTQSGDNQKRFEFMCKATALPATTVGVAEVWYRGRKLNLAGDRSFEDWTTTIYNDAAFKLRNSMEVWAQLPDQLGTSGNNLSNPTDYQSTATVYHLDRTGKSVRAYTFHGLWPSEVGTIELDYETNDAIETFDVTWKYNYFTVDNQGQFGVNDLFG
jgi:hypothetical protein